MVGGSEFTVVLVFLTVLNGDTPLLFKNSSTPLLFKKSFTLSLK